MLTPGRGLDIIATQRPRNITEPSPDYAQKFGVIVLPERSEPRNPQLFPDIAILRTNHPKTEILKTTQGSLAHIFINSDRLEEWGLDEDFLSLYLGATHNAPFYNQRIGEPGLQFINKYMQAIGQTALKSEMMRKKMILLGVDIAERGDDFGVIRHKELKDRFMRKISDEGIYTQYQKMTQVVPVLETLSSQLIIAITKQRKDIDFGPDGLEKRQWKNLNFGSEESEKTPIFDPSKLHKN